MFVRCWFILFLHLIDKVSLQDPAEIIGGVGGSVILPCSYKERVLNTEEINVFWRYNNSVVVFDIEKGNSSTKEQDAMFKDRIDSFPSDYKKGNFSIRLKHLSFTSIGEFSCFIQNVDKEYKLSLQVRAPSPTTSVSTPKTKTTTRNSSLKTQPDGIVTFLTAVLGVYMLHYIRVFY